MAAWAAILKIVKPHLLPNLSQIEPKIGGEAWGPYGDLELQKSCRSDIQYGQHVGHLEILQITSSLKP